MRIGQRRIAPAHSVAGSSGVKAQAFLRIYKIIKPKYRMDLSNAGGIAGLVSLVIVIVDRVIQTVNHKRVRSKCCGRTAEASLDVENTTPPSEKNIPMINTAGLITFNEKGEPEVYNAALKKKVPYRINPHIKLNMEIPNSVPEIQK
jgi:hypothetical protein